VNFYVNLKILNKLINSAFVGECVNCLDFKMHGAALKTRIYNFYFVIFFFYIFLFYLVLFSV